MQLLRLVSRSAQRFSWTIIGHRLRSWGAMLPALFRGCWQQSWYQLQQPAGVVLTLPRLHFLLVGYWRDLSPHPLFDVAYYRRCNPDVVAANGEAVGHYFRHGWQEGRKPCALFDGAYYMQHNPEAARTPGNPLLHYLRHGQHPAVATHPRFSLPAFFYQNQESDHSPFRYWLHCQSALAHALAPVSDCASTLQELLQQQSLSRVLAIQPEQEELLQILFSDRPEVVNRFYHWIQQVDIKNLDDGSYRLYPYLYKRLQQLLPEHPLLSFFKGNYRKTFYRNHLLMHRVANKIKQLRQQGIEVIVMKGAALLHLQPEWLSVRPMSDVDLLVRPEHLHQAFMVFSSEWIDPGLFDSLRKCNHGFTMRDQYGFEIDLHCQVFQELVYHQEGSAPFWEAAKPGEFFGVEVNYLQDTDLFLHLCIHGGQWNPLPPIRWIADCLTLMGNKNFQIQWPLLLARAQRFGLAARLYATLRYLSENFAAAIPAEIVQALACTPLHGIAQTLFRLELQPWQQKVNWEDIVTVTLHFLRWWRKDLAHRPIIVQIPASLFGAEQRLWCQIHELEWWVDDLEGSPPAAAEHSLHPELLSPDTLVICGYGNIALRRPRVWHFLKNHQQLYQLRHNFAAAPFPELQIDKRAY